MLEKIIAGAALPDMIMHLSLAACSGAGGVMRGHTASNIGFERMVALSSKFHGDIRRE